MQVKACIEDGGLCAKFGDGVVVSYEGNASDLAIKVNFGREGLKTLMLEYAKLEKR